MVDGNTTYFEQMHEAPKPFISLTLVLTLDSSEDNMPPQFQSTYSLLPDALFRPVQALAVDQPSFILTNAALASRIGIDADWLSSEAALQSLSGNTPLPETASIAMAYAGHQFGHFVPSLGDGRAVLIGEVVGPDGVRRDLHLKGAGRTPYSRGGDGRATLGAMLREYIVSEAMAALGIPTTRSLAVVATGETVPRERLEQGAVLTRIARSHVRVGTFQYLAARGEDAAMQALVDYEMARNFSDAPSGPERFLWFLRQVIGRQATLIAQWMNVGFIHGVMNTDNMSVCGETIDYGPCAFMDAFHPQKVFSSIDQNGRYAWDKQPVIALWNLTRLAEAMLPLFDAERATAIALAEGELRNFMPAFEKAFESGMARKFGLEAVDSAFIATTLQAMVEGGADFTLFFSALTDGVDLTPFFAGAGACETWMALWHAQGEHDAKVMRTANPVFIPRNHRVEQVIAAANAGDLAPLHRLLKVVTQPFQHHLDDADLAAAPAANEEVTQTFCGT
jgi:serine/tyrosine/threonine adenylyltransferase